MNINIYQIDTSRDRKRICFFGLDEIKELTGEDRRRYAEQRYI